MQPTSLSASAGLVFEGCEARYNAEYIQKIPDMSGSAGALGTACHTTLETWVAFGCHLSNEPFSTMEAIYNDAYYMEFSDQSRFEEGLGLVKNWFLRQNWDGRKVLSTELKETFDLTTADKAHTIPFTYIWDRCDEWDDGTIEVVDYKSVALPVQPEDLKKRIQPRAYALAAAIKYPGRDRYLITYDLLRYDHVGAWFTREDNVATWKYLQGLFARILASDGTTETLNPECRWCVRKGVCETLLKHAAGGGLLGIADAGAAADKRDKLDAAKRAIQATIDELDNYIMDHMESEDILDFDTPNTHVSVTATGRRKVDSERVAKVLGPEMMARYGTIGVTQIDDIMKNDPTLTSAQKSELKQLIRKEFGKPYVKTKPITTIEQET